MNATADVPSSRLKNYRGGGDRKDGSLFAARVAAILLVASIAAAAFLASHILAPPLRSLLRSSSSSASSPLVLWLFVVVVAAAIWILYHASEPPHCDGIHFASGLTAQLWHDDDDEIPLPTMSEYYYYGNYVNAIGESAFEAEGTRRSTRVVESPKEEEDDESMETTWKAIVRRRGVRKSEEITKDYGAIDLPRKVVYKVGGYTVKEEKKAAVEGWRKRELGAVANDELFRRVETFIKKHYDHLRLQQQESEQSRLLEMFRRRRRRRFRFSLAPSEGGA